MECIYKQLPREVATNIEKYISPKSAGKLKQTSKKIKEYKGIPC